MNFFKNILLAVFIFSSIFTQGANYTANKAAVVPTIDGDGTDVCWSTVDWAPIDQLWLGPICEPDDFTGRFKAVWSGQKIYLLVEITDDVLRDTHPDPLDSYPDDDCVEVFVDEDLSGGIHNTATTAYNAFAYHVSLTYDAVDTGIDGNPHLYNNNITTVRKVFSDNTWLWEMAVTIYDDSFVYGASNNKKVNLSEGKMMGFSLAYCDNDASFTRENFIGSQYIPVPNETSTKDANVSYINASHFGVLELGGLKTGIENISINRAEWYYNAAQKKILISSPSNSEVKILNTLGQVVLEKNNQEGETEIPLNNFNSGIYFLLLRSEEGTTTQKFLVY